MTIDMIKANNLLAGQYFFSRDTMRFFKSKVYPTIYGGKYFITRETDPRGRIGYTIREAVDGGKNIKTVGGFHVITELAEAKKAARACAEADRGAAAINEALAEVRA